MGYKGRGPLGRKNRGLLEPIEPAWREKEERSGVGYQYKGESSNPMHDSYPQVNMLESNVDSDDSRDYEWDTLSKESCHDKEVVTIHTYAKVPKQQAPRCEEPIIQELNRGQALVNQPWIEEFWDPLEEDDSNVRINPRVVFPMPFPIEVLEDSSEEDFDPSSMDHLEEAHVIDLNDKMYEPSNEVTSINLIDDTFPNETSSLINPDLID